MEFRNQVRLGRFTGSSQIGQLFSSLVKMFTRSRFF